MTATEELRGISTDIARRLIESPLDFFAGEINAIDALGINETASRQIDLTDEGERQREGAPLGWRYVVDVVVNIDYKRIDKSRRLMIAGKKEGALAIRTAEAKRMVRIYQHLRRKGLIPASNSVCNNKGELSFDPANNPNHGRLVYKLRVGGTYTLVHRMPDGKRKEAGGELLDKVCVGFYLPTTHFGR